MHRFFVVVFFALLSVSLAIVEAGDGIMPSDVDRASLSFMLENDYFSGHDENYTNGASLGYMSASESGENQHILNRYLGIIVGGENAAGIWRTVMGTNTPVQQQWGVSLTQLMFTPQSDMYTGEPLYGEHPYAGWLSLGFSGVVKNESTSNTFGVYLGVLGPAALGKETQDLVHTIMGCDKWQGWSNQLKNEPTIMVSMEKKIRLPFLEMSRGMWSSDGFVAVNGDLGNVYIRGGGYVYFRAGYNLPSNIVSPGWEPSTHNVSPFSHMRQAVGHWSIYGLCGMRGRASAWDIFLDGNMLRNSRMDVDKYPLVGEFFAGVCVRYKQLEGVLSAVRRTKEYHEQREPQWMGSFSVRWMF